MLQQTVAAILIPHEIKPHSAASAEFLRSTALRVRTMIRCKPKGLCSWNFFLEGEGHHASLEFNWLGEQGAITADDLPFEVQKHGVFSGHWTLDHGDKSVASAQKTSPFTRTFKIQDTEDTLLLCAESALGRSFCVERSGEIIATIQPDHAFTRRATIETLGKRWSFSTVCFAFWLVVLTWRRAASSNSAASGGAS